MQVPNFIDNSGTNIKIESTDNGNGITVLNQYNNNKLIESVEVTKGSTILKVTDKNGSITNVDANDYLKSVGNTNLTTNTVSTASLTNSVKLGRINYSFDPYTSVKHSVDVEYVSHTPRTTTYTVNSYTGTVVSLVAAIISVCILPAAAVTGYIIGICASFGLNILGGVIQSALSTTLAATSTGYTQRWTDLNNMAHYSDFDATVYVIIDSNHRYSGNTYTEGELPWNWQTVSYGEDVYLSMYGVSGMVPISHGSY